MLNKYCVDQGLRAALAFGSKISEISTFDRKHYFYPDLPNGFQITQHYSNFHIVESIFCDYF